MAPKIVAQLALRLQEVLGPSRAQGTLTAADQLAIFQARRVISLHIALRIPPGSFENNYQAFKALSCTFGDGSARIRPNHTARYFG